MTFVFSVVNFSIKKILRSLRAKSFFFKLSSNGIKGESVHTQSRLNVYWGPEPIIF